MNRYIIGSLWDRANRNGANKNFEYLFEGSRKIDELNYRAEGILTEAQKTNDMNKDVQSQVNEFISEFESTGETNFEVVQARGEHDVLNDRLNHQDKKTDVYKDELTDKIYTKSLNPLRNIVTFYFDDGNRRIVDEAKPILDELGVPATICSIAEYTENNSAYLNIDELLGLIDEGWSIDSHTYSHPNLSSLSSEDEIEYELRESKKYFNDNGIYPNALCYPEGRYDDRVLRLMRKYYDAGVASVQGKNSSPINQFEIKRILIDPYTIEQLKTMVDNMENEWYIFYTHVTPTFTRDFLSKYEALVRYVVSEKEIDVLNFYDAFKEFRNRIDIGDSGDKIFKVGADGRVDISSLNYTFLGQKSGIKNSSPIAAFPKYKVSIAAFNSVELSGIPYGNGIGTLITYRIHEDDALSYQDFKPYNSDSTYTRRWISNDWSEWVANNYVSVISGVNNATPITFFPAGKITYTNLTSIDDSGIPISSGNGILITNRISDDSALNYQEFKGYNTNKISRRSWISSSWSPWETPFSEKSLSISIGEIESKTYKVVEVNLVGVSTSAITSNPHDHLPEGLSYEVVPMKDKLSFKFYNSRDISTNFGSRTFYISQ